MRILFADDSASMRQMLSIILTDAGHEVVAASNGIEAYEKLTSDIDAVITDYNMPEASGSDLIKRIRSGTVNRSVPILVLTTERDGDKKELTRTAGASGWMSKPFRKDTLLSALEKITRKVAF